MDFNRELNQRMSELKTSSDGGYYDFFRFWGVVIIVSVVVFGFVIFSIIRDQSGFNQLVCPAEDEVPMKVLEDSYDWKAGENLCVHVDNLN